MPFNWKTQSCSYGEGMQLGGCCRGLILLSGEAGLTSDSCPHSALRRLCTPISARSAVRAGFLGLRDWAEMEGRTAEEALHRGLPHTQVTEQILLGLEHRFEGGGAQLGSSTAPRRPSIGRGCPAGGLLRTEPGARREMREQPALPLPTPRKASITGHPSQHGYWATSIPSEPQPCEISLGLCQWFGPRPVASTGNLLEMKSLWTPSRPTQSETLKVVPRNLLFSPLPPSLSCLPSFC